MSDRIKVYVLISENKAGYKAVHNVYANYKDANMAKAILNAMDTNKTHELEFFVLKMSLIETAEECVQALHYYTV